MKKLVILKSLVDFVWIITCIPMLLLMAFFAVYMFIDSEVLNIVFDEMTFSITTPNYKKQIFGLLFIGIVSVSIYCLYIFRNTLRYFQKAKPFHIDVIKNFQKIGYLLSFTGLGGSVLFFVARILLKGKFKINLGLSSYILIICLGLFFMVLSEVFKVAKYTKEENDLTI